MHSESPNGLSILIHIPHRDLGNTHILILSLSVRGGWGQAQQGGCRVMALSLEPEGGGTGSASRRDYLQSSCCADACPLTQLKVIP